MGPGRWWTDRVVPRLVDRSLASTAADDFRRATCADASGTVLEVGFGSGRNLPFYPEAVDRVLAIEPADLAWDRAAPRIARFGRPVDRAGLDAASIDLPDASIDAAVSTWTLCTIPHLPEALAEVRRLLRPEGSFYFVEHGLAPDASVARVQHRIQPVWGRVAGGCHLTRDLPAALSGAGLQVSGLQCRYENPLPLARPFTWFVSGRATV